MTNFWLSITQSLNHFLMFFGLRGRSRFWGIVYDSRTKEPIDPAIVKLINAKNGEVVSTCVTDLYGRYGFLIFPGMFKIFVRRTNYNFPSIEQSGDKDGDFSNLYHGEFFKVSGETDVINLNIPLDPIRADWNQTAKSHMSHAHPHWVKFRTGLVAILFWLGFAWSVYQLYLHHTDLFYLIVPAIYAAIICMAVTLPEVRMWGEVINIPRETELRVELSHLMLASVVIAKSQVALDGKYFLRAPHGKYLLKVIGKQGDKTEILKQMKVRVGDDGIVNKLIEL